jgi:hypothetical protein
METFDVAAEDWCHTDAAHKSIQIHRDAGLVAIDIRDDDAGLVGIHFEDRAKGAIEFRVHENEVFAVLDRGEGDVRGVLDRASDLDHGINTRGLAQQQRILGNGVMPPGQGVFKVCQVVSATDRLDAGFPIRACGAVEMAVGNGHQPHSADGRKHLQGDSASHESRTHHGHADRLVCFLAAFKSFIDDDHFLLPFLAARPVSAHGPAGSSAA